MYYGSGTVVHTVNELHAPQASGQPADAAGLLCSERHGRHLESVTSYQKSDSVNRCEFIYRLILASFVSIQLTRAKLCCDLEKTSWLT